MLVLHPRYDEDSNRMAEAAVRAGWAITRIHPDEEADVLVELGRNAQKQKAHRAAVVVYGGPMFGHRVAQACGLRLVTPPDDWLIHVAYTWRKRLIDDPRTMARFRQDQWLIPVFIKSVDLVRPFDAKVFHSADELPVYCDDAVVVLQEPVRWLNEYRAFVSDGQIRTISQYAEDHQLVVSKAVPTDAIAFLCEFLTKTGCLDPLVVDVGYIKGRGWAIVEANPAWCSGLYGCDADEALAVVAAACQSGSAGEIDASAILSP